MNSSDKYLEDIFKKARNQAPEASFAETSARFMATITTGGSVDTGSWYSKFFSLNSGFFLTGILGIIILGFFIEKKPALPEKDQLGLDITRQDSAATVPIIQLAPQQVVMPIGNTRSSPPAKAKRQLISNAVKFADSITIMPLLKKPNLVLAEFDRPRSLNLETKINTPPKNSIDSIKTDSAELKPTAIQFTVTESTTTTELAGISGQARKAGIEYFYVVDLKRKLIAEFNANMTIYGTRISSDVKVSVPKKGKFEVTFGWFVDKNGKAVKLMDDVNIAEAPAKHSLRIATARKLFQAYLENGIGHIEQNFDALIVNAHPKEKKEDILNQVGYLFIMEQAYAEAIEIFELNTRLFPEKANPWDSLGEAYYKSGDKRRALTAFQKALSINRKLSSSRDWVRKIEEEQ